MLHFFKFRQDLFAPQPAKDIYVKRPGGRGWPEECPPIRAANAFGYDILANFDVTFTRGKSGWKVEPDVVIDSDFDYSATEDADGKPLSQQYAWFWEKGQKIPHPITDDVYEHIQHQVKVSSFLYLKTDPNELLFITEVPNLHRPYRAVTALVDTDWYPASYPWHVVLEFGPEEKKVHINKGEPLARIVPVRRDTYFAKPMSPDEFDTFFARGQQWLATHGKFEHEQAGAGVADITRTYVRQQIKSRFVVLD